MTNTSPTPDQVMALRQQVQAHYNIGIMAAQSRLGDAVGVQARSWRQWEEGRRSMPAAAWTLALLRTNSHPQWRLVAR